MAGIAASLVNAVLGLANIGAGIGFGAEEEELMKELSAKGDDLKKSADKAGDMYDHIYYLVAVNLDLVKKSLDKLPNDFVDKVQKGIIHDTSESKAEEAIKTVAEVMGYSGGSIGVAGVLVKVLRYFRNKKAQGEEPSEPGRDSFENVPLEPDETLPVPPEQAESSFTGTPRLDNVIRGLDFAGIVFGLAGLGTTIGLGVWTLEKLKKAIADVKKKKLQVTKFQDAMEEVLNEIVKCAGLPPKSYSKLVTMASTWKEISSDFDSYQKVLLYSIEGYFMNKSLDDIKEKVAQVTDPGKPFPDDGYPLAKTLADDIKFEFKKKKTDKEIVAFFATENPKISLRFVFDEFFINSLRFDM